MPEFVRLLKWVLEPFKRWHTVSVVMDVAVDVLNCARVMGRGARYNGATARFPPRSACVFR